ncbi:MalY/PatB family protein [Bifidobacterium oedipodis]|uniref:cysteine-S-conjugate beta-lyase n=1 Tax=Bifidobacterium oedipodis TaxID=2675322 RepID=A0A7Y0EMV7_9BIFI|nr:MalY/PatB family protein [Bifidobacterium sp. DSM 109957]NMM93173.1 cystathionine beta-lyase [Bifidobacterium sp. DSM 109957]
MSNDLNIDFDKPVDRTGTYSLKWDEAGDAMPMWVADMDFPTAPAVREALQRRLDHGVFGYSVVPDEWAQAYAGWWRRRHGFTIEKDWLIFATGVVPAISSMVRKLTTPAENVVIMTPVFNIFFNSILNNGRNVLESPLAYTRDDEHGLASYDVDWDDLTAKLADPQTSLMILCNPANPAGRIWDKATLVHIAELAWEHHVTVISDEIHCDLTDPGVAYVPFASVSDHARMNSVTCLVPTKTFNMAGMQTAAVFAADPTLRHKVWRGLNTDEVAEPNAFAMTATIAALNEGEPWLEELRTYLAGNKRLIRTMIDGYNASPATVASGRRVALSECQATYLPWLDCSTITHDTDQFCDWLAHEKKVMFSPGAEFGGNGRTFLRINAATQRAKLEEAMRRLISGLSEYKN